jgi:hypothetical protein
VVQKGVRFDDLLTPYYGCAIECFPTMVDNLTAQPY